MNLTQPLTVKQLAGRTSIAEESIGYVVTELRSNGLVHCLNEKARRSRLYWLTELGGKCQRFLCQEKGIPQVERTFSKVDWDIYGSVCFNQRAAIIKSLTAPQQPADIKRKALSQNPDLKMSANNVRDIIKIFLKENIVQPVTYKKKAHPSYELTETGIEFQNLLRKAESKTG